jgi:hypothetical protein
LGSITGTEWRRMGEGGEECKARVGRSMGKVEELVWGRELLNLMDKERWLGQSEEVGRVMSRADGCMRVVSFGDEARWPDARPGLLHK